MDDYESLSHIKWERKYHIVSRIEEGHLQPDHVHMLISIPPKYVVSQVVGFLKGKSAIPIARVCTEKGNEISLAKAFGSRFFVSTVGRDEAMIREYFKNQEAEDNRLEQLSLWR